MPSQPALPAASNHVQSTVEVGEDLGGRQAGSPGGGELDRQREPVQPAAQPGNVRGRLAVEHPRCARRARPREEQLHGRRGLDPGRVVGRWQGQGVQPQDVLAWHRQRLAAGRQNGHPRAVLEQQLGHLGHRVQQVLAVVEDQQPFGLGQADQRDPQRREPQRFADRARDLRGVGHPGKLTNDRLRQLDLVGCRQGQARLAHPSRPDDRHQRARVQEVPQGRQFGLPADQHRPPVSHPLVPVDPHRASRHGQPAQVDCQDGSARLPANSWRALKHWADDRSVVGGKQGSLVGDDGDSSHPGAAQECG
jgi:hypothetical protein